MWGNVKFYFKALQAIMMVALYATSETVVLAKPAIRKKMQQRTLQDYETYLQKIQTLIAHIEQQDPKGRVAKGILYIKKPGKMRLTYLPQKSIELITVGDRLVKYDWATKESDSISLANTPLQFLMQVSGKFTDQAKVEQWIPGPKWTQIILRSKQDPEAGQIKLIFQEKPSFRLFRWVLIDVNGNKTIVTLEKLDINIPIASQVFEMKAK
jgi:outer membrane lipoprotein-sorting protein